MAGPRRRTQPTTNEPPSAADDVRSLTRVSRLLARASIDESVEPRAKPSSALPPPPAEVVNSLAPAAGMDRWSAAGTARRRGLPGRAAAKPPGGLAIGTAGRGTGRRPRRDPRAHPLGSPRGQRGPHGARRADPRRDALAATLRDSSRGGQASSD